MSFGTPSPFDAMLYGDEAAQRLGEERARKALAEDIAREQRRAGLTDGPTVDTSRMQLPIGKPTPMEETLYGRQDAQRIANERARKQFAEEIVREQVRRAKAHAPRPPAASSSPAPRPTPRPTPRPAPPPRPQGELDAELLRKAERANLPTWIRTAGQARHYQRIGTTAPAASAERLTSFDAFVAGLPAGSTLRDALASLGAEQEAAAYDAGLIAAPRLPAVGYTGLAVWTAVGLGSAWLYDWGLWLVLLLFVASSVAGSLVDREPNGLFTFGGFFGLTLVVAILRFTLGVEHPLGPVLTALAGMSLGGIIWYGHGVPGREREMARKAAEARVATRTQSIAAREAALEQAWTGTHPTLQWEPRRPPAGADPMQGAFFRMLQEVVPSLATRWWAFNVRHRYREDVALLAQRMLPPGVWDHLPPADQRGYLDRLMQGYDAWNAGTRAIAYHGTLDEADFRAAFGGLMPATTTTAGAASLSPSVPPAAVPPEVASPVPPADDDAPPPGRFSRLA